MDPESPDQKRRVREDFDRKAGIWGRLYEAPRDFRSYNFHTRRRTVLELLPKSAGVVLDVGCGTGDFIPSELARASGVIALEISAEMSRICRERYGSDVRERRLLICRGDIEALPLPNASVGGVVCVAVIEYLLGAETALKEIARVLAPGGFAIITVPNRVSPFIMIDNATKVVLRAGSRVYRAIRGRPRDDGSYMHGYFSPWDLNRRIRAVGLTVERRAYSTFGSFMYSNSIPFSVAMSESLDALRHRSLGVLGSNYIVLARRSAS